ncbi:hypothetical protein [Thermogymnomonas acidicola]|uniref:DUF6015 family protein n=1 Tax=Thermogymnomonas acidicola TaxID=399579 RepID=UPI00094671E1|nr:DUF6015 family protein [Thermogymnomonas acidicola]
MPVMTREVLISALDKVYGKRGMGKKDIEELCDFILSFFGYEDYVLDNVLTSPERDVFYNLEEYGILTTYREEVNIIKGGKTWRINQWTYNRENINRILKGEDERKKEENIYDEIFRELE